MAFMLKYYFSHLVENSNKTKANILISVKLFLYEVLLIYDFVFFLLSEILMHVCIREVKIFIYNLVLG